MTHPLEYLFWIAVACCAVAQVAIVRALARAPAPGGAAGEMPRPGRGTEIMWAVVPAVALAVVFAFTWRAVRRAESGPPSARLGATSASPALQRAPAEPVR